MRYFLDFLKEIRKHRKEYKKAITALVILIVLGLVLDSNFENSFLLNLARSIISILSALLIFSLGYLASIHISHSSDIKSGRIRKRWSINQRINIAIILVAVFTFFYIGFVSPRSIIYTLVSSLYFTSLLTLVSFVRPIRDEVIAEDSGIKDKKDIEIEKREEEIDS